MKKTLTIIVSLLLVFQTFTSLFVPYAAADGEISVGDTVLFGRYEQDGKDSNGAEDIKWRVLSIDEESGTALLLSWYILDIGQYNDKNGVYWENSLIRSWLNSYFFETAFSSDEQTSIALSKVSADKNPKYDTANGNGTEDYVFLLSYDEATSYLHYAEGGYMKLYKYDGEEAYINLDMISFYTPAAAAKGGYTQNFLKTGFWWCRTMGINDGNVCNIANTGYASTYGHFVTMKTYGVRPAVRVSLDALKLTDDEELPYYGKDKDEPVSEEPSDEPSEEPSAEPSEEPSKEESSIPEESSAAEGSSVPEEPSATEESEETSDAEQSEAGSTSESDEPSSSGKSEESDDIFTDSSPVRNKMWWLGAVIIALIALLTVVFVRRISRGPADDDDD